MKKFLRYFLLFSIAAAAIYSLVLFERFSIQTFNNREKIFNQLYHLKTLEESLDFEILKNSFFLYQNYDNITEILQKLKKHQRQLDKLLQETPQFYTKFVDYKNLLSQKEELIEEFKRYNSAIKNSTAHIATVLKKIYGYDLHHATYERRLIDIVTAIFLAKNSMDPDFLNDIEKRIKSVEKFTFSDSGPTRFHTILLAHIKLFTKTFPKYSTILHEILDLPTKQKLEDLSRQLTYYFDREVQKIDLSFKILILFYILSLGAILFFTIRLDKENEKLQQLQKRLANLAILDDLTKLYNRRAYKQDVRKVKKPFFALVNIDGFKHYNDFYGTAFGDHLLRQSANIIKRAIPHHYNAKIYRIGADEFGILIEEELPIEDATFAQKVIEAFKSTTITFKTISLTLNVSVAMTRKRPLLETADLTMKHIKKERRFKYMTYKESFGFLQEIKENIKRSKILKEAIEKKRLIPFFQPIINNETLSIEKYEVLARLKHEDGTIESIYPYLSIAKELGLYDALSKQIIEQAVEIASRRKMRISVNISMKDIENPHFLIFLGRLLKKYPEAARMVSFEILESETLRDYEAVKSFISIIKSQGGEVGIDDFGSGYSNFSHIFNLDIDFIKIDGSLIRGIDQNRVAHMIVENIVQIAKKLGIKTVAEFIANKRVLDEVIELGIDYSQGFFLGEPEPLN